MTESEWAEAFAVAWNEVAAPSGMKKCIVRIATRDPDRRRKIMACRELHGGLADWKSAFERLADNAWFTGSNSRSWKASLDYVIAPTKRAKIIEDGIMWAEDREEAATRKREADEAAAEAEAESARKMERGEW